MAEDRKEVRKVELAPRLLKTDETLANYIRVELPKIQREVIIQKVAPPMLLDHAGN